VAKAASILFSDKIVINDNISIYIPTVGEVIDNEEEYYNMASLLTATPYDMMVQLDDLGLDFTQMTDYDLFLLVFESLKESDTSLIFGDFSIDGFKRGINAQNQLLVLRDRVRGITIDKSIAWQIAQALRRIHGWERNNRKPANKEACAYLLERARIKQKRRRRKGYESQLEGLIVSLVNTPEFKYDFEGVRKMSIFQFNESLHQIIKKVAYDNRMYGVYAGTVDADKLSPDDKTWLTTK